MLARRKLLGLGLCALGSGLGAGLTVPAFGRSEDDLIAELLLRQSLEQAQPTALAAAKPVAAAPRWLKLHNLHTEEKLEAVYYDKGEYVPDALVALNTLLRDYRSGDVHPMNIALFDALTDIAQKTETKAPFRVISGYRSPKTNAMLNERSGEVAKRSLHMDGKAIDIYLEDVALDRVRAAALDLNRGGVGYYPTSKFVHVDVGPVRRWTGS